MRNYRIGIVGTAHMHVLDLLRPFLARKERFTFVGVCDLPPEVTPITDQHFSRGHNLKTVLELSGMPQLHSMDEVLSEKPDLVIVCTENARHGQVCSHILRKGIHVLVEKPMAFTLAQAYSMVRASKLGGGRLIVNWPTTWSPAVRTAQRLVAEGAIGRPFRFHYRNAASRGPFEYGQKMSPLEKAVEWWHQEAPGGGATMDYCCYGCCLSRWFLGQDPISAFGVRANFDHRYASADDYGTITALYPEAVAHVEGSWTTVHPGVPNGPIVSGLGGTLVADAYANGFQGEVYLYDEFHSKNPPKMIPPDPLPEGRATIAEEILCHLDTGEPLHPTLDLEVNLGAMKMLDAGIRSAKSGIREMAGSVTYTIGE